MEVVSPASMEKAKDTPIGLPQSQYTDFLAPATTTSPSRPSFHKRLSAPSSPLKREEQSNQTQSPDNGSDGVSTTKTLIRRFSKPPTKGESDTNSPTRVNRSKSERIGAIVKRFSRDGSFINTCETEVGGSGSNLSLHLNLFMLRCCLSEAFRYSEAKGNKSRKIRFDSS